MQAYKLPNGNLLIPVRMAITIDGASLLGEVMQEITLSHPDFDTWLAEAVDGPLPAVVADHSLPIS